MQNHTILFINGEVKETGFFTGLIDKNTFLVAVDGGLRHLLAIKRQPNLLIGDLDSITPAQMGALIQAGVEIQRFPVEKDETDLELALLETARRGYKSIQLVGALGGRTDQMLANLFLLLLPELAGLSVRLVEEQEEIFIIRTQMQIVGQPGDTISLIPFAGYAEGVSTSGLCYPLVNETLYPEHSRGISNQMQGSQAMVTLTNGNLLCIHSWRDRKKTK